MSTEMEETQPIGTADTQETVLHPADPPRRRSFSWIFWVILGWLLLGLVAILGAFGGYQRGLEDQQIAGATELALEIEQQYELGLQDYNARNCERARQRFAYIIEQDPGNERAAEMLAKSLSCALSTATPTPATPTPTPTVTPTPDSRAIEELFEDARAKMAAEDWDGAITLLLNLRKKDPFYEAVEVDSMLYVALRNRGVNKILHQGELEGGLYDLSQAERFGPLDAEATSFSNFARFYLIGASFWQVDWGQSAFYFGQVAPFLPNLHDGTGWRAMDRYQEAMTNYLEILQEAREYCAAADQLETYRQYVDSEELENLHQRMRNRCEEESNDGD